MNCKCEKSIFFHSEITCNEHLNRKTLCEWNWTKICNVQYYYVIFENLAIIVPPVVNYYQTQLESTDNTGHRIFLHNVQHRSIVYRHRLNLVPMPDILLSNRRANYTISRPKRRHLIFVSHNMIMDLISWYKEVSKHYWPLDLYTMTIPYYYNYYWLYCYYQNVIKAIEIF